MIAYLAAQFCDVRIFHMMKRLTKGGTYGYATMCPP